MTPCREKQSLKKQKGKTGHVRNAHVGVLRDMYSWAGYITIVRRALRYQAAAHSTTSRAHMTKISVDGSILCFISR